MTAAEIAAWVLAVGAFALYGLGEFARTTADAANMATASAWSSFGMAAVVVLLPAALILTGVRQLLPSLRDVLRGEKVTDAQDS